MKGTKDEQQSAATKPPHNGKIRIGHSSSPSSSNSSSNSSRPTKVSLLLAHFFSLVLIPLIFPETDRTVFWKVAQHWTTKPNQRQRPRSRRPLPKTPMQQKFYISDPHVHFDGSHVFLDYQMAASVVSDDVIRVSLYDWECQDELVIDDNEKDEKTTDAMSSSWKMVSSHPPERLTTKTSYNNNENDLDFPTSTWRLTLDVTAINSSNQSPQKEGDQTHRFQKQLCVRWMLHNLPWSHEYSMEVTFQRTQLQIEYDVVTSDRPTIQTVQVEFPEEVGVDVHVDGRGRAVVYDAEL